MSEQQDQGAQIETVRCLSCGAAYAKPLRGGNVQANPGCPECAYVGWVLASGLTRPDPPRSAADRPQRRSA